MKPRKLRCFLAVPHSVKFELREAIVTGVHEAGYQVVSLDRRPVLMSSSIQEAIIGELANADCIIADVSERNPNVFFELGLAQAMGKGILIMAEKQFLSALPFDIREFRAITYSAAYDELSSISEKIRESLDDFRRFPIRTAPSPIRQFSPPFFVEWDRLEPSEMENLCKELLAQLGFRRLDWEKDFPDIDLIAELPKKDPDGYEYRELWLVSMGLRAPIEMLMDPEYLLHRIFRYRERGFFEDNRFAKQQPESSITLLIMLPGKGPDSELEMLRERIEKRRFRKDPFASNVRIRIWDQNYLTSLVQKFPQIGYKYFSVEGRIRSMTRKSYEDLYLEVSELSARQAKLIVELEEEKNRRIRAERDSVWKDISFAAAHKIGNPIFAIETDLEPLLKRIREGRKIEAEEVVDNMRSAIEKAKAFVEQFKSLAKAQKIKLASISLNPILEDACKQVLTHGIECKIECPPELTIKGDADRLVECFDELVMNATHWFDKAEKKIEITVMNPAPEPLPKFLDTANKFLVVHVRDNGCGIPASEKSRIFDAFFTKYEHGTGLGLALVRRIIDGHGGGIVESGMPGKGADFEVYLPIEPTKDSNVKRTLKKKLIEKNKELKDV